MGWFANRPNICLLASSAPALWCALVKSPPLSYSTSESCESMSQGLGKPQDTSAACSPTSLPLQEAVAGLTGISPVAFPSECQSLLQRLKQFLQYCLHLNICLSDRDSNRLSPISEYAGPAWGSSDLKESSQNRFSSICNIRMCVTDHTSVDTHVYMNLKTQPR